MTAGLRLTGSRLRLARGLWIALVVIHIGLMLAALPARLTEMPRGVTDPWPNASLADVRAAYTELGLSLEGYAAFARWSNILFQFAYVVLGLFLAWHRSDDPMVLLLSLSFIGFLTTGDVSAAFGPGPVTAWLDNLNDVLGSILGMSLFYVFPDGRFVPRWTRWAVLALSAVQLWRLFFPDQYLRVVWLWALPSFVTILVAQIYRYFRASGPVQRQQIKWVVFGLVGTVTPLIFFVALLALNPGGLQPGVAALRLSILGSLAWSALLVAWPATITIAVLRYRLFDIDVLIRRTLIYSLLSGLLALAYFGTVVVLESLLRTVTGSSQNQLAAVVSTLAIAALFVPLRARVQRFIDRRFYRKKYDAARTLVAFGATLRDEVDLDALTQHLTGVVDETLQPASVGLWLKPASTDAFGTTDQRMGGAPTTASVDPLPHPLTPMAPSPAGRGVQSSPRSEVERVNASTPPFSPRAGERLREGGRGDERGPRSLAP